MDKYQGMKVRLSGGNGHWSLVLDQEHASTIRCQLMYSIYDVMIQLSIVSSSFSV